MSEWASEWHEWQEGADLTWTELFFLELVRPECTDVYVLIELIELLPCFCGNIYVIRDNIIAAHVNEKTNKSQIDIKKARGICLWLFCL